MNTIHEVADFKFANLEFKVRNPKGLFSMTDGLKNKISLMTIDEAKAANSEAWKMKRASMRTMNRYNNVTRYGHEFYDTAAGMYGISDAVCKETYKRMRNG